MGTKTEDIQYSAKTSIIILYIKNFRVWETLCICKENFINGGNYTILKKSLGMISNFEKLVQY